ncbi:sensor histidine kinase (plasmid) [Clostridium perfringens]|uniref:histidine kinase n=4 Tax=Clostridium perfringens TaxID=1502 RepID=A0A0N7BTT1_CLOPF|nr:MULTISPECIES: HAMP domain-containing sensor histidine kinase [Clostridium]AKF16651.1 two-component sensor histidine kinase [Clostridium perfringens]AMN30650.1 histidine kinase [Clostridium perfringens]
MNSKFKGNIYLSIYLFFISIILFIILFFKKDNNYLTSALFYIRILNIILSFLALNGTYVIYLKNKNSTTFILSLMYLCFSIGIICGNIDYFIFNNEKFSFSNYITISTSLLRIFLLIISVFPYSKVHKFIYKSSEKAIVFVITYSLIFGISENIFKFQNVLANKKCFFILYNIFLIIIYLYVSIKLLKLSKSKYFILKYFSASIILLALKAIYAIYGIFYISFDIKLISVSITSLFFITIIIATGVKLYSTIINYNLLNNELIKFFNFVENNKHSNMFICDYNFNIFYVNKKIKEYYSFKEETTKFKNDLLNNKHLCYKLKDIFNDLENQGYWSGFIKDYETNEILDCYAQSLNNNEVLVSYVDISSTLELEETLENIKFRDLQKDEFLSNISHELKTPLNIFYSTIQLLEKFSENENINFKEAFNKHSNSLKLNCKRMIRLVNNIVDLSRMDLGVLKPDYGNYNIILLVEDISNSIIPFALSKNLLLEFDTNVEEHYIMCDPIMIERILLNILSNAIKYSEMNTTIHVYVSVEKSTTKISIKDEGCGIDLETQKHIFDRFIRADTSFTRLNEGCGLGLSIVKSMLDILNGDIRVESELGKGSIFEVSLPNKIIKDRKQRNYKYENSHNISVELSDIYEIN